MPDVVKLSRLEQQIEQEKRRNGGEGMKKAPFSLSSSVSPFLLSDPVVLALRHWLMPLRYQTKTVSSVPNMRS